MKYKKRILGILLIMAMVISLIPYQHAETASRKYLVISYDDGNYWGYNDMVERTSDGALMIPAKEFAENFGFGYINTAKERFALLSKQGDGACTYTLGEKEYIHADDFVLKNKTAKYAPISSNHKNMIHCGAVSPLLYCKYFPASEATEYKENGYAGVLLYSRYPLSDSDLPRISYIENAADLGLVANNTEKPEDTKKPSETDTNTGGDKKPEEKEPTLGEMIDSNLESLKEYIRKYGGVNKDGKRLINYSFYDTLPSGYNSEYKCAITLNEATGELTFLSLYEMDGTNSSVTFVLNPDNAGTDTIVTCLMVNEAYGYGYMATSTMIIALYNEEDLLFVPSENIGLTHSDINEFANLELKLAMRSLDLMLHDKIGMSVSDIGFTYYK